MDSIVRQRVAAYEAKLRQEKRRASDSVLSGSTAFGDSIGIRICDEDLSSRTGSTSASTSSLAIDIPPAAGENFEVRMAGNGTAPGCCGFGGHVDGTITRPTENKGIKTGCQRGEELLGTHVSFTEGDECGASTASTSSSQRNSNASWTQEQPVEELMTEEMTTSSEAKLLAAIAQATGKKKTPSALGNSNGFVAAMNAVAEQFTGNTSSKYNGQSSSKEAKDIHHADDLFNRIDKQIVDGAVISSTTPKKHTNNAQETNDSKWKSTLQDLERIFLFTDVIDRNSPPSQSDQELASPSSQVSTDHMFWKLPEEAVNQICTSVYKSSVDAYTEVEKTCKEVERTLLFTDVPDGSGATSNASMSPTALSSIFLKDKKVSAPIVAPSSTQSESQWSEITAMKTSLSMKSSIIAPQNELNRVFKTLEKKLLFTDLPDECIGTKRSKSASLEPSKQASLPSTKTKDAGVMALTVECHHHEPVNSSLRMCSDIQRTLFFTDLDDKYKRVSETNQNDAGARLMSQILADEQAAFQIPGDLRMRRHSRMGKNGKLQHNTDPANTATVTSGAPRENEEDSQSKDDAESSTGSSGYENALEESDEAHCHKPMGLGVSDQKGGEANRESQNDLLANFSLVYSTESTMKFDANKATDVFLVSTESTHVGEHGKHHQENDTDKDDSTFASCSPQDDTDFQDGTATFEDQERSLTGGDNPMIDSNNAEAPLISTVQEKQSDEELPDNQATSSARKNEDCADRIQPRTMNLASCSGLSGPEVLSGSETLSTQRKELVEREMKLLEGSNNDANLTKDENVPTNISSGRGEICINEAKIDSWTSQDEQNLEKIMKSMTSDSVGDDSAKSSREELKEPVARVDFAEIDYPLEGRGTDTSYATADSYMQVKVAHEDQSSALKHECTDGCKCGKGYVDEAMTDTPILSEETAVAEPADTSGGGKFDVLLAEMRQLETAIESDLVRAQTALGKP